MTKRVSGTNKPDKCWNPELFPGCQYCQWLMDVTMKVGKKFLHCPRPEAKHMRVWMMRSRLTHEMERHAIRVKCLTSELRQFEAELGSQMEKP